jgi:glycosyl transferase family 87
MALLIVTFGCLAAGLVARGDPAGADARAYWAAVRIWLGGGDPYRPTGPFLPYVYAPWMLPLFAPWALLPWDVAWFVWRGATILLLLWSIDWAYRRRPLETAIVVVVLAFPIGANLDTGNITLLLAIGLFGSQFLRPRMAGFLWGLATWMKWAPAPLWLVLRPRARLWGLVWLAASVLLSIATLPLTIIQMEALFGFDRPTIRLDYLVLLWALVPWLWRQPEPFGWLRPASWSRFAARVAARVRRLADVWRADPDRGPVTARREVYARVRAFLGIV